MHKLGKTFKNMNQIGASRKTLSSPLFMLKTGIVQKILNRENSLEKSSVSSVQQDEIKESNDFSEVKSSEKSSRSNLVKDSSDENSFDPSDDIEESISNTVEINIKIKSETRRRRTAVRFIGKFKIFKNFRTGY